MPPSLTYAVVTPARNEGENLPRLAESLASQSIIPVSWTVVDDASTDNTGETARGLARTHPWMRVVVADTSKRQLSADGRGAPIVAAFHAGLSALESMPDVVAKVDADVSFGSDYFERLLERFVGDERLGIASGTCLEHDGREWRQRYVTGTNVWGAARAYRRGCLQEVLPLEERMGWDGIDVVKANARGWRTETVLDLPFRHHRLEAGRERNRWHAWVIQGDASHFMGYRFGYVVLRTGFRMRDDLAAAAMLWGFIAAKLRRAPTCTDSAVRAYVRRSQRMRELPRRRREALGR